MNKDEARRLALARLAKLRQQDRRELRNRYLQRPETVEVRGPSGTTYQVETDRPVRAI